MKEIRTAHNSRMGEREEGERMEGERMEGERKEGEREEGEREGEREEGERGRKREKGMVEINGRASNKLSSKITCGHPHPTNLGVCHLCK